MPLPRLVSSGRALGASAVITLILAGCASQSTTSKSSTSPSPTPTPTPTTAAALATELTTAMQQVHSAHLTVTTSGTGAAATTAAGALQADVTTAGGHTSAFQTTATVAGQTVEILYVDKVAYVKLPTTANSATPWTKVSASSSNPVIAGLAQNMSQLQSQSSLNAYNDLLKGATGFQRVGPKTINGVKATEYTMTVNVASLPADSPAAAQLKGAGVTTVPVIFYVDGQNRPVQITETLTLAGAQVTVDVKFSKYNQPITIQAPPASQVSAG